MLQLSDTPCIKQIVAPWTFKLVNGQVNIDLPADLMTEVRDKTGKVTLVPYKFPMSQQEIETKVLALKRIERIAAMSVNFRPYLLVLNSVTIQATQRGGRQTSGREISVDQSDPWQKWQLDFEAQLEKATKPEDVTIPPFPLLPPWFQDRENLQVVAEKLGQSKNLLGS
jgi:hypothetical protein